MQLINVIFLLFHPRYSPTIIESITVTFSQFQNESLESIAKTFKLFQDKNGIINCEYLITALKDLKYDQQEPVIYDIIDEVCSSNKKGLSYDEFVSKLNEQLQDRMSQKSTERTFALFAENPNGNFTFEDFKRVADVATI